MKIVKTSATLEWITPEPMFTIERAGRTCYKSEDKFTNDSAAKFVLMLIARGHEAMIEHASASFRFVTDRGISHEIVRHRLASYSQECVAGSTKVTRKYTIKELYDRGVLPQGKTHNKTIRLRSCREDGTIIRNKIVRVMHKGKQPTHRVTTKLGYIIEATGNHEFMLLDGSFRRLAEIDIGSCVMVNGRPSLLNICDEELKHSYLNMRQSPQEIADSFGAPYVSVLRRLKQLDIFVKHRNDKSPEKYNRNHTAASYAKMHGTILKQYQEGREPWNKDVREGEHPSVDRQAASLRAHHHNNQPKKENSNWQGGGSTGYYLRLVPPGPCELCSSPDAAEIHHIDRNRKNNERSNLVRICINCHDKLHYGWHVGVVAHPDEIVSIEYVGEQEVYDIEMEAPHHNYVASGFVVHNSTRYCNYSKEKFGREITVVMPSWLRQVEAKEARLTWAAACEYAEVGYFRLIDDGAPPQVARSVLPTCLKTEIVMTANLREWRHFIKMRLDKPAHPDVRLLAHEVFRKLHENCWAVVDDLRHLEHDYRGE